MNKEQLTSAIAAKTGKSKKESEEFLNAFVQTVTETLSANDNVPQAGFGSLTVKERKATTGRNPRTGEPIEIDAKNVVKFTVSKPLKDAVNG